MEDESYKPDEKTPIVPLGDPGEFSLYKIFIKILN